MSRWTEPPTPFENARAVLALELERVRLWLERYLRRYGHRLVDSGGRLEDGFISVVEALAVLERRPAGPPAAVADALRQASEVTAELAAVERHLAERVMLTADVAALGLEAVASRLRLTRAEQDVLVAAVAFHASLDYARLYRFAWADFTLQQPTVGFLADLVGGDELGRLQCLDALSPGGALCRYGLLALERAREWDGPTPQLYLRVRVPDEVTAFAQGRERGLGVDAAAVQSLDPRADDSEHPPLAGHRVALDALRQALRRASSRSPGVPTTIALVGPPGSGRTTLVHRAAGAAPVLVIDAKLLIAGRGTDVEPLRGALRHALLTGALPVVRLDGLVEELEPPARAELTRVLDRFGLPMVLVAPDDAAAQDLELDVVSVAVPPPGRDEQQALWRAALGRGRLGELPDWVLGLVSTYQLTPGQIEDAARRVMTGRGAKSLEATALVDAIRRQLPRRVAALATRTETHQSWGDLVLPDDVHAELAYLTACARHVDTVYSAWNFGSRVPYGRAISALFSGPPGTGKTMAASVVAHQLGRELYRVDLSRVVDKYVGETEKNLGRLFDHAERAQAVLLFDEADALFAKRTDVKSSNDRYANLGVNYLLQRMEAYNGVTILTTNFADSLDEALARRISVKVRFPLPDRHLREKLWRRLVPPEAPVEDAIDWTLLADTFELAGGHIKSAVLRAAFSAAEAGEPITLARLWAGAVATYRELDRLVGDELQFQSEGPVRK